MRIREKARHRQQNQSTNVCGGETWASVSAYANPSVCGQCVKRCFFFFEGGGEKEREEDSADGGWSTLKTILNDIN